VPSRLISGFYRVTICASLLNGTLTVGGGRAVLHPISAPPNPRCLAQRYAETARGHGKGLPVTDTEQETIFATMMVSGVETPDEPYHAKTI